MAKYSLVADVDGTLVGRSNVVTPAVRAAIERLESLDVTLILASGRPRTSVVNLLQRIGLHTPFVSSNGNEVSDGVARSRLLKPLSRELTRSCLSTAQRHRAHAVFYTVEGLNLCTNPSTQLESLLMSYGEPPLVRVDVVDLDVHSGKLAHCHLVRLEGWNRKPTINEATILRSEEAYMTVTPTGVNKGVGVRELLRTTPSVLVVVGDGENDLPMFALPGAIRVSMFGGSSVLAPMANVIAPSVESDGFAWVVKEILEPIVTDKKDWK